MPLANQVLGLLVFLALFLFCQMEHIAAEALLDDAFSGTIAWPLSSIVSRVVCFGDEPFSEGWTVCDSEDAEHPRAIAECVCCDGTN